MPVNVKRNELFQIVWQPLEPEYYGSDQDRVNYIVAIQKLNTENVVIPDIGGNRSTQETIPKSQWEEATVYSSSSGNYTFRVRAADERPE